MPSNFEFLSKKNIVEETIEEKKETKVNQFGVAFEILGICGKIKDTKQIQAELDKIDEKLEGATDYTFIASIILKLSIVNKVCLEYNYMFVDAYRSMPSDIFIKFFLKFCIEHKVRFPPFIKYYNCGLMASKTKYLKFFEDQMEEEDFELLKLIMNEKMLSAKDLFQLQKVGLIEI